MRILVIGASGFIGSTLVPMLREAGHQVVEGRRYVAGRWDGYQRTNDRVFFDLRDTHETRTAIMAARPEVILNLAAQSAVTYSFDHAQEVNEVNYMGTLRVSEAALELGAHLVIASSSEVYGSSDAEVPFKETSRLGATSPYAVSKMAAEEYLRVLHQIHAMPMTIMRPFNTIGRAPVNNRHFVVERTITQALEDGRISLHDPRPLRDFLFRDDHCRAYLAVVEHLAAARGQTFNLCTGDAWSISDMVQYVAKAVGQRQGRTVSVDFGQMSDRPLDIPILQGSASRAKDLLGWAPQYTIAQGLDKAIDEWQARLAP